MTDQIRRALLQRFKMENASNDSKQKLIDSLDQLIQFSLLDLIMGSLSQEQQEQFLTLFDQDPTGEKAYDFAKNAIPDLEKLVTNTIQKELNGLVAQ